MAKGTKRKSRRKDAHPRPQPLVGRAQFAKISEVEGVALTDDMKRTMAEFDRLGLSPEERRRRIIERFRRTRK